jgi:hypothetical protein
MKILTMHVTRARDLCTFYATENTDYLIYPLSFDLVEDEASHLLMSVYALNKLQSHLNPSVSP